MSPDFQGGWAPHGTSPRPGAGIRIRAALLIREVPAGRAPEVVGDLHGAAPVLGADALPESHVAAGGFGWLEPM